MDRIRKTSNCIDCNKIVSEAAKRCTPCYYKYNTGAHNGNWGGGVRALGIRSKTPVSCIQCKTELFKRTDEIKVWSGLCRKCSNIAKGAKMKGTWRIPRKSCVDCGKTSYWIKEGVRCKKCSLRFNSGENHYHWKGGITPHSKLLRGQLEYTQWRTAVFKRDNYTCQNCSQIGGALQADHIKPFAYFKELRYSLANGRTLCKACHLKIGWRRTKENLLLLTPT